MDIIIPRALEMKPTGGKILNQVEHYHHQILKCLGYPTDAPPLGELLAHLHGLVGDWLVVSPIYWQAFHNDAMLLATGEDLNVTPEEGEAWFQVFADFVATDFPALHYHDPYTWLMQVDRQPLIDAKPPHLLRHQSMMPELSRLDSSLFWQTLLTELQMLFSQHPLNHSRKNHYPINGIWVWGKGHLDLKHDRCIVVDSVEAGQMAQILATRMEHLHQLNAYPDNALILLENNSNIAEVQIKTKHQCVNWYWKNHAYQTNPTGWFRRLWSVIC
ncbi:MAG TPA: hypothetical protein VHD33_04380 [Legionellaceae bacterium]|nr:hypothetical protein [Legionellaceae bacterium]